MRGQIYTLFYFNKIFFDRQIFYIMLKSLTGKVSSNLKMETFENIQNYYPLKALFLAVFIGLTRNIAW